MKKDGLLEILFNAISHGLGALYGVILTLVLLINSNTSYEVISSIVFGFAVFYMFMMSTLYHSLVKTKAVGVFKRLDHSAIYFLIASSFVPYLLIAVKDAPDLISISILYTVAITGIVFKAINPRKYKWFHIGLFLAMGWTALFFVNDIYAFSQLAFYFLTAGGIMYTVGVIFYAVISFKLSHFVWHLFVLFGLICHSIAVYIIITI